jgi:hypothetical protein
MKLILANQSTAAKRRMFFYCVSTTDGMTPVTGEAGGQPQISTDGGAFTNTGIGTLIHLGNGQYYGELTQSAVATVGTVLRGRYKSANTAEIPCQEAFQIVAFNPDDVSALGLTGLAFDSTVAKASAVTSLDTKIGTPVVSVSTDIANLNTNVTGVSSDTTEIINRIGDPGAGSIYESVTTVLDRIGAFSGIGWNTILGFFRALLRSDGGVTLPSDVGGTYTNTADSLQAIRTDVGNSATNVSDILTSASETQKMLEGRWKIHISGPDANRMVFYDVDGITPLKKFDLFQSDGVTPTVINPFERKPV